jgi:hypothetical protein
MLGEKMKHIFILLIVFLILIAFVLPGCGPGSAEDPTVTVSSELENTTMTALSIAEDATMAASSWTPTPPPTPESDAIVETTTTLYFHPGDPLGESLGTLLPGTPLKILGKMEIGENLSCGWLQVDVENYPIGWVESISEGEMEGLRLNIDCQSIPPIPITGEIEFSRYLYEQPLPPYYTGTTLAMAPSDHETIRGSVEILGKANIWYLEPCSWMFIQTEQGDQGWIMGSYTGDMPASVVPEEFWGDVILNANCSLVPEIVVADIYIPDSGLLKSGNRDKISFTLFEFPNDFAISNGSLEDVLIVLLGVQDAEQGSVPPHLQPVSSRTYDFIYTVYVRASESILISGFPKAVFSVYIASGKSWQPYERWFGDLSHVGYLKEAVEFTCKEETRGPVVPSTSSGSCEDEEHLTISDDLFLSDSFEEIWASDFPEENLTLLPYQ